MVATPTIVVSHVDEIFQDDLGQYWSPAEVTLKWPPLTAIDGPSVVLNVVASSQPHMTLAQLHKAHLSAAHDVLSAALLAMEEPGIEASHDMRRSSLRETIQNPRARQARRGSSRTARA